MSDVGPRPAPESTAGYTPPAAPRAAERFAPGTLLDGRYRVVALLGKGGMGEVYRADDLRLGQSVALKFLPPHLAADPERLQRFLNEARVARQVSHPNVCRVHDIGEVEGQPFLSMEYIDGEDLASLLKRIGRLPEDKAVELARQLCAGLAAAHEQGVLHRDLKPRNVMIDGRGRVRITDFGLAGDVASFQGTEIRAGTPAYQAPEQLAGQEVTVQSDLYALGLVLYEMFTGKQAFPAHSRDELARLREEGTPATPSSHVPGLSSVVERVILRCLERDPARRPRSAVEVAAGLPGGDPLAAALAAGETPSPQMVAHAGEEGTLPPRVGLALLGLALAGVVLVAWLNDFVALFRQVPAERSPRELAVQAQALLRQVGYTDRPTGTASGLATDEPLLRYLRKNYPTAQRWDRLETGQPAVMYFWYRQSPQPLAQRLTPADMTGWSMPGRVLPNEPPLREPGMTCVFLDLDGRLLEFHAVPPHLDPPGPAARVDWGPLLKAAGLLATVRESRECWRVPPVFADARAAWEGHHPERPDIPLRIEAAAYRGRPVYFHTAPEKVLERVYVDFMQEPERWSLEEELYSLLPLIAVPLGGWLAWRNWWLRRANPRGTALLVACFVGLALAGWVLAARHVWAPADELAMFAGVLGRALLDGVVLWLAYMALEPWVRRRSPWRVIAWNRLLGGDWRNPLVGRDVLLGVLGASAYMVLSRLLGALSGWLGGPTDYRQTWDSAFTEGAGAILLTVQGGLVVALRDFFVFFLLLLVSRRDWLAAVLMTLIWVLPWLFSAEYVWIRGLTSLSYAAVALMLLLRTGLLAYVAFVVAEQVLRFLPMTTDLSAWYAGVSTLSLLTVAGLAMYGCWAACRNQPLFAPPSDTDQ
ncbi:MAG: serine/threonine protein kinase [Gemmataceae bacterium]|nr:serine/threonine protein kinase [Gemmataceae bacterium]